MLFNTLAYAKFFGAAFIVTWILGDRRGAVLLPWLFAAGYTLTTPPSAQALVLVLVCFAATLLLARPTGPEGLLRDLPRLALLVGINHVALAYLTLREHGLDPLSYGLSLLGVKIAPHWGLRLVGVLGWPVLMLRWVRSPRARLGFLLGSSYVFYACWDYRFVPLLFASSSIDYWLAARIGRARGPRSRKRLLALTIALNLGVLAVFKYFELGVDTTLALLSLAGIEVPRPALAIALPVGVSFFTFESMSYVIDVYRRELDPHPSYVEYLAFVAFFPHLVAGPIVRPRDFLPQLAASARWDAEMGSRGLFLIGVGLLKKVAIGDYLALNLVDRVFDAPLSYSSLECYAAVVAYALQIYCDFSGYTDIAIGSALLLGLRLPKNFDAPYTAGDVQEFWRRWHISLSTWLRDYLYVPLGGGRRGPFRTAGNLMVTMLLGGLWHGASFTFVAWGGLHGLALVATRAVKAARTRDVAVGGEPPGPLLPRWLAVALTFHWVCFAWIFFRSESFAQAHLLLGRFGELSTHHGNLHAQVLVVLALGLGSHFVPERWLERWQGEFARRPAFVQGLCLFAVAWVLQRTASADSVPFVYFQF